MSLHKAKISWKNTGSDLEYKTYDRTHAIQFGGGEQIQGSSAPEYLGKAELANPEELLAAAASSCHMLTFLAICAKKRLIVTSYTDEATAHLEQSKVTLIELRPQVEFADSAAVSAEQLKELHEGAHKHCFIANSVSCPIQVI